MTGRAGKRSRKMCRDTALSQHVLSHTASEVGDECEGRQQGGASRNSSLLILR